MVILLDIPYLWKTIFAACRISLWFILLFGVLGPLFLDHTKNLPRIEKLIYSWVGVGGTILFTVFALTILHIYDFISLVLTLLLIPLIRNTRKSGIGIRKYFRRFEMRMIIYQVKFIENFNRDYWKEKMVKVGRAPTFHLSETFWVILIALTGGLTRIYPALKYAAPFNRNWFIELNKVKYLRLQHYFSGKAEPAGMHSLVSVFSMLTQISPEMILHILGALTSFFLCIIIYWGVRDITKDEYPAASFFAMALYAVAPMFQMPLLRNYSL